MALLFALVGCHKKVSPEECARMLDRYVEMTAASDPTLAGLSEAQAEDARRAAQASKKREPRYAQALAQCEREVTRAEYECAVRAPSANDWEACIE